MKEEPREHPQKFLLRVVAHPTCESLVTPILSFFLAFPKSRDEISFKGGSL